MTEPSHRKDYATPQVCEIKSKRELSTPYYLTFVEGLDVV